MNEELTNALREAARSFLETNFNGDVFRGIAWLLCGMGYGVATHEGKEEYSHCCFGNKLGVLCPDPEPKYWKLFWAIPIKVSAKRLFLGTIHTEIGHCSGHAYLVFEVNGRKHLELAKELATKITGYLGTHVVCFIKSEEPVLEVK